MDREDEDLDANDETDAEADDEGRRRSGAVGFVGGLVLGTLIGAGIALLVAPARGAVTRRRIKRIVQDIKEQTRDKFDDAREELAHQRRNVERRLDPS